MLVEEQSARRISHGDGGAYAGFWPSGALGSGPAVVSGCGAESGCAEAVGGVATAGFAETMGFAEAVGVVAAGPSGAAVDCLPFLRFFVGSVMLDSVKYMISS